MNFGLTDNQLDEIIKIISRFEEIESAVFFGSRALNNHKEASDVDIAIKGSRVTIEIAIKVHSLLEETNIPFFFDVLNYNSLNNEELKFQIDKHGIQFYSNQIYHHN
jgi:predicted nucleotidyltransferase